MIETRDLSVSIGGSAILSGIDLAIRPGRVTALVGPNGAGKSTLLAAMGRLQKPSGGEVLFDGAEIGSIPAQVLARRLAILRQSATIAPRLTVADLAGFGRYPHSGGHLSSGDREIVAQCLADVDMSAFADRYLDTISGGQRQRAMIAMALAQTPEVLLLDEPLNNLDLGHVRRVMNVARSRAEAGAAVVIVLHDLTIAARYADDVVALKAGKVFASGDPASVVSSAVLSNLYETPVDVRSVDGLRVVIAA